MLAVIGDLVDDVVVRLGGSVNEATDTVARIERRRGGSAANVAVAAVAAGSAARFLGQVGDDPIGQMLVDDLSDAGVDVSCVRRRGRTGTIVVLVDRAGERSMLSDRGAAVELVAPDAAWLDGVGVLHLPLYGLDAEPLASTVMTVVRWAHERGLVVSVDVSSVELIQRLGRKHVFDLLGELRPHVVLANGDEAEALGIGGEVAGAVTVVKQGPDPVIVYRRGDRCEYEVPPLGAVTDTTGAGDAFAAGFLVAGLDDPAAACRAGCRAAARVIAAR